MKTYKEPSLKLHKLKMQITILAGSGEETTKTEIPTKDSEGGAAKQATFSLDDSNFDEE